MSKSTDIFRVKLGAIQGALLVFKKEHRFSRTDIKQAITDGLAAIENMAKNWPIRSSDEWTGARWDEWAEFVHSTPDRDFGSSVTFAYMCERLVSDLVDEYGHSPRRMAYVKPISESIGKIVAFCDPGGKNIPAYRLSKDWLNRLDEILGLETV